jgi:hypothetical protein
MYIRKKNNVENDQNQEYDGKTIKTFSLLRMTAYNQNASVLVS